MRATRGPRGPRAMAADGTTAVLFDVPGPRARARNRVIGGIGILALLAIVGYVVYRFAETGQFSGTKWSIFQYANVQRTILDGYLRTLAAAGTAAVLALVLGTILAAGRLSDHAWLRRGSFAAVEVFRAIPLLLLMFLLYYGAPTVGMKFTPFWAVVIGLTVYNGAVFAELFRAGVESVPRGQSEAGYAVGLRKRQLLSSILLPQAIRSMLPAVISQLVVLLKDTALGFLVTYDELLKQLKQLATAGEFEFPLIPLVIVGGSMYVATCLLLAWFAKWLERRLNRSSRQAPTTPTRAAGSTVHRAPFVRTGSVTGE